MRVETTWSPPQSDGVSGAEPVGAPGEASFWRRLARWFTGGRSLRTRLISSYVVLLATSAVVTSLVLSEVLIIRLDQRIQRAELQEVLELRRMVDDGRDPTTGEPFTSLTALFDVYFARNVPSSGEGMVAFVGDRVRQTAVGRLPDGEVDRHVLDHWRDLADDVGSTTGRIGTDEGELRFRVEPVELGGESGAFVVAHLPRRDLDDIADVRTYSLFVALGVLLIAGLAMWPLAGRVLAPLRALTTTAHTISESDLTGRIRTRGSGEAVEMAQAFNAMLDRLESAFRSQRAFVQDASHELRDPLTICRGHLELLTDDDPEDQRATVALVLDELNRIARIVDDLQVLADADQPDFVRRAPVDLGELTVELLAKASALGPRNWQLDGVGSGTVLADRHRLTEAVLNLAHNAVHHTTGDQVVAVGSARTDDEWRLWVRDTGVGVPEADHERIFERFARGAGSRRTYQGAGLGLAIVTLIAGAHDGRVELVSSPGHGSTFTIVIPRRGEWT
ncbi:sensor histidine kinase [Jiangella alkaliphila]|uniref:histidine kinase n=1 Tax=Jiangella alkaliphila TaxID=419479 RepID=A0A1H2LZ14_9ACTN|nr:ATP-binding protein [Jiangella alkaliphila]SDU85965.1 Signal transduction histidine kinase [Jiangella alkaliphila]